jgi:aminopeptidase N
MRNILIFIASILIGCNSNSITTIKLIDEKTSQPVEGAWIHNIEDYSVLRSDVNGEVDINPKINSIEILSKNYRTIYLNINEIEDNIIKMKIDSSRINLNEADFVFTEADTIIGTYNELRSNNDLLFYDLDIKIDVQNKFISGVNKIKFKMLEDTKSIQIDLHKNLQIDSILFNSDTLKYQRKYNSVIIDFPLMLKSGNDYNIDFYYSGFPQETGRFGGIVFQEDSLGNPWIFTACQGPGANVWWPNKDQQFDEPDSMEMSVTIPDSLIDISNGHLISVEEPKKGLIKYNWKISYPINNYCVALNISNYTHFSDSYDNFSIDYYVLPYHLKAAQKQFKQVVPMLKCYEKYFGNYPFAKDGYKLVEVPYSGMEHQTAVSYGNLFKNGYLGRDWTGVGISTKFDFIIIHESGHEWFGNIITAADDSDALIHEGWTTYAEAVYVECMWGYEDALKYLNGYKNLIYNREPILGPTGVNHWPTRDMYFKGALLLNTLRSIIDDDELWWNMVYDYSHHFRGKNIYITNVITYINQYFRRDLTSIFEQYLMFSDLPVLEIKYNDNSIQYRWKTNIPDFNMPIKAGFNVNYEFIYPTSEWQNIMINPNLIDSWKVDIDRFYIDVKIVE